MGCRVMSLLNLLPGDSLILLSVPLPTLLMGIQVGSAGLEGQNIGLGCCFFFSWGHSMIEDRQGSLGAYFHFPSEQLLGMSPLGCPLWSKFPSALPHQSQPPIPSSCPQLHPFWLTIKFILCAPRLTALAFLVWAMMHSSSALWSLGAISGDTWSVWPEVSKLGTRHARGHQGHTW